MKINNLELPKSLLDKVDSGEWKKLGMSFEIKKRFPEAYAPCFYSLSSMKTETDSWLQDVDVSYKKYIDGNLVNVEQIVLIADLGMDMPIALNYVTDPPHVMLLGIFPNGWRKIANNIEEFIQIISKRNI